MFNNEENIPELLNCPVCNYQWRGTLNIYEELRKLPSYKDWTDEEVKKAAENYGHTDETPLYFSKLIGIEMPEEYDGTLQWQCPNCKTKWDRFTNKIIEDDK